MKLQRPMVNIKTIFRNFTISNRALSSSLSFRNNSRSNDNSQQNPPHEKYIPAAFGFSALSACAIAIAGIYFQTKLDQNKTENELKYLQKTIEILDKANQSKQDKQAEKLENLINLIKI